MSPSPSSFPSWEAYGGGKKNPKEKSQDEIEGERGIQRVVQQVCS